MDVGTFTIIWILVLGTLIWALLDTQSHRRR